MFSFANGDNALSHHIPFHFQGWNKCHLFLQMSMCLKRKNNLKQIQVHHTGWMIGDFFLQWFTLSTDGWWWGEIFGTMKPWNDWLASMPFCFWKMVGPGSSSVFEASDNKGWLYATEISQKAWGSMVSKGWYGHGVLTKMRVLVLGILCDVEPVPATVGNEGLGLQSPNQKYQNIILVGECRIPRVILGIWIESSNF